MHDTCNIHVKNIISIPSMNTILHLIICVY